MSRIIALEYAIAGACDGGAYVVRPQSMASLADAIADCAGLNDGNELPPGADPETWHESMVDSFMVEARDVARQCWHYRIADYAIRLPWRPGFVVRCWRMTSADAAQFDYS